MSESRPESAPESAPESKEYFRKVAGDWDRMRSGYFTECMRDAAIALVNLPRTAVVADVGTGTGFMIQGLAPRVAAVCGFDESPEMLRIARQNLAGFTNVELREAAGEKLLAANESFDAVFANMYLHHAPDPAAAIAEMVRVLRPEGSLVLTDLDAHDQTWMREQMADRWLGFARSQVQAWYAAAGLTGIEVSCAEGSCRASAPNGEQLALSIFVARGRKPRLVRGAS